MARTDEAKHATYRNSNFDIARNSKKEEWTAKDVSLLSQITIR